MKRFNENLAYKNLSKENVDYADIQFYIEFSYVVSALLERNDNLKIKLNEMVMSSDDGIQTYSFFIIYLYESYTVSNADDYVKFISNNLEEQIKEFEKIYFYNVGMEEV